MTLKLDQGTTPNGLEIKTGLFENEIKIGDYVLTMQDFCAMVEYVLTNDDLYEGADSRRDLVRRISNHILVISPNGKQRIEI